MAFPGCSHVSATDTSRPTGADYIYCLAQEVRKLKQSIAAGIDLQEELLGNVLTYKFGSLYESVYTAAVAEHRGASSTLLEWDIANIEEPTWASYFTEFGSSAVLGWDETAGTADTGTIPVSPVTLPFYPEFHHTLRAYSGGSFSSDAKADIEFLDSSNNVIAAIRVSHDYIGFYGSQMQIGASLTTLGAPLKSTIAVYGRLEFNGTSLDYINEFPVFGGTASVSYSCDTTLITQVRMSECRAVETNGAGVAFVLLQRRLLSVNTIYITGYEVLAMHNTGTYLATVEVRITPTNTELKILKRDATTLQLLATIPIDSNFRRPGTNIKGVCFNGNTSMYVSYVLQDFNPAYTLNGWIVKINLATFAVTGTYRSTLAGDANPVTFVGGYLFTVSNGLLRKIDPVTMTDVSTFADLPIQSNLLNDGTSVVYISASGNILKKIDPATDAVTTVATVFATTLSHIHGGYLYVNSSTTPNRLAKISLTTGAVTDINADVLSFWRDTTGVQCQREIYDDIIPAKLVFGAEYKAGLYNMLTDTVEYAPAEISPRIKMDRGFMIATNTLIQAGFDQVPVVSGVLTYTLQYMVKSDLTP